MILVNVTDLVRRRNKRGKRAQNGYRESVGFPQVDRRKRHSVGYRATNGFLQAVIRVTACTSRTLGFLPRMRASGIYLGIVGGLACSKMTRRRATFGYRYWIGLRRNGDDSEPRHGYRGLLGCRQELMHQRLSLGYRAYNGWCKSVRQPSHVSRVHVFARPTCNCRTAW